ncbi:MAG: hypothetical protein IT290_07930 [Deltaproteobacteria bacterium]|nr:hypothetical protein [Deltaproteobacteria bacterium]
MFRSIGNEVWAFDCEWAPDPHAGRRLYHLADSVSDEAVIREMWKNGGATELDPQPYLKTVMCRLLSIVAVVRSARDDDVVLSLHTLPQDVSDPKKTAEEAILSTFLSTVGKRRPQIVGFNSVEADLRIIVQRGVVHGLCAKDFSSRPNKPWEGEDYFSRHSEGHLDLRGLLCGFGKSGHSLHEIAVLSGIPGKMDVSGSAVVSLWLEGRWDEIVHYNQFDALTTYLLWLRVALFAGHFSVEQHRVEEERVEALIQRSISEGMTHLQKYSDEWQRLRKA